MADDGFSDEEFGDRDDGKYLQDDDDFEYGSNEGDSPSGKTQLVQNQPFDEAVELSDSESIASARGEPKPAAKPQAPSTSGDADQQIQNKPFDEAIDVSDGESVEDQPDDKQQSIDASDPYPDTGNSHLGGTMDSGLDLGGHDDNRQVGGGAQMPQEQSESSSDDEDEDDDSSRGGGAAKGGYNPADYTNLPVSAEIQELFQHIGRYKPKTIELDTTMKPFVPDYIPAVGDIDAFLKMPRPDQKPDNLGLSVLDEPGGTQSDPTVLDLQLRATAKQTNLKPMIVRSIDCADKPTKNKAITAWVNSINELHRTKPPTQVNYTKNMPDIEQLMQVWPAEFEQMLQTVKLPTAELDVDLQTYARLICCIMDIPVYNNIIESLHVLFTLYSEFKNNQHFQQQAEV